MDAPEIAKIYDELHKAAPGEVQGVGHRNEITMALQYDQVFQDVERFGGQLLDVGCGYGGLYGYIQDTRVLPANYWYKGIDSNLTAIDVARAKYPLRTLQFHHRDLLDHIDKIKHWAPPSVVAMVGTLSFYDPSAALELVQTGWNLTTGALVIVSHRDTNALLPDDILDYLHPDYYKVDHSFDKDVVGVHLYKVAI